MREIVPPPRPRTTYEEACSRVPPSPGTKFAQLLARIRQQKR